MTDDAMPQTANLRRQLADIHAWWTETASHYEDPVPLGAVLLEELVAMSKDLATLIRDLEASLYDLMPGYVVEVEGVGTLKRGLAADSEKFESDVLLRKLVDEATPVDPETGEFLPLTDQTRAELIETLEKALPITPSLSWRKTGLTEVLGDEWKDHHEKVPGRKTVRFL